MSSGSSGVNVTAPEPLCWMVLLTRRMMDIEVLQKESIVNVVK